jgi:fructokinase
MNNQTEARPVIVGEVLFDCFPDGSVVMGGAPLNVAWHLHGFGADPLLISRLGTDDNGQAVIDKMTAWGLDLTGIQRDTEHPTGRVEVSLNDEGQPEFSIVPDQAYDFIDADEAERIVASRAVALLYHGSLAVRNPTSRQALMRLRRQYSDRIFVDINLRAPWWDEALVDELVNGARWLKLNDVELSRLSDNSKRPQEEQARDYAGKYDLQQLILTLGDKGACLVETDTIIRGEPVAVTRIADTVGAGDAFSAVTILGILKNWPSTDIMPRALEFAALLCTVRGATLPDRDIYRNLLEKWGAA